MKKNGNSLGPKDILKVVENLMTAIHGDLSALNLNLFAEIESMKNQINTAKGEISAHRTDDNNHECVPTATDELSAIIGSELLPEAVADKFTPFISLDPVMLDILSLADQVAPYDASVLITGESGTGKEVLARHLHAKSSRAERQFIVLNCAAVPEGLLESELFGHEMGSFTGAVSRRIGKFEEAHRGTLLLDEISEMHPRLQAKLLRAVQEREIDRIGGSRPIKVDIRLLATSNRNLEDEVRKGNFREDLYFRLNVVNIELPALRDRPRDIEVLAEHFVAKYAEANGVPVPILSAEARELLRRHHWRGNVRELENAMHRAVIFGQDNLITPRSIFLADGSLPINDHTPMADVRDFMGHTVAGVERALILDTLQRCGGNRTHAAKILGISIRTLRNKLHSYQDIPPKKILAEPEGECDGSLAPGSERLGDLAQTSRMPSARA